MTTRPLHRVEEAFGLAVDNGDQVVGVDQADRRIPLQQVCDQEAHPGVTGFRVRHQERVIGPDFESHSGLNLVRNDFYRRNELFEHDFQLGRIFGASRPNKTSGGFKSRPSGM
jgi:hypothetical protein